MGARIFVFLPMHQCLAHFGTLFICLNDGMLVLSCSVSSDSSATPWTVAHQAPLSMGFPRQEYWSGLPFPSPGDLPNPGIKLRSSALQTDSLLTKPIKFIYKTKQNKVLMSLFFISLQLAQSDGYVQIPRPTKPQMYL